MTNDKLKRYNEAKKAVVEAEKWNNLPKGRKYQNDAFLISESHCTAPILVRAGQQYCGGNNYWNTEKELNNALLSHIVENWAEIYPAILVRLRKKEAESLRNCQVFIDDMQKAIDAI